MPSSSARRRNAPNLISPLHRAHGFGVRPAACSATKSRDHRPLELRRQVARSRTRTRRSARPRRRRRGPRARSTRARRRRDARGACASPRPRSPARRAGTRRPTSPPRRTSRPARIPRRHGDKATVGLRVSRRAAAWPTAIVPRRDRGAVRRSDGGVGPRSASSDPSACSRRAAPTRSPACSLRPRAPRPEACGWPGSSPYEAAPGPRPGAAGPGSRTGGDPFVRAAPARGSRCSRTASETALPEPPRRTPLGASPDAWRAIDRPRRATTRRSHAIREHIAAGDTYQVNHTLRLRSRRRRRRAGSVPRPLLRAAGRVRRLSQPRAVPRPLRLARALLPDRRRPDHDAPDEGHGAAGPLAGRGRRGGGRLGAR